MQRPRGWRQWLGALGAAAAALHPAAAHGLTLDWDANPWPDTSVRSQTYTIGGGDVTVSIADPGVIDSGTGPLGAPGSVETSSYLDPTGNGGASNLFLKTVGNTASPWVTLTITFSHSQGVRNVDFQIFDIDEINIFGFCCYTDGITVTGSDGTNTYDPSITAVGGNPSWSAVSANTLQGTRSVPETGNGSENGTAEVVFDQVIHSLTVIYRNELSAGQSQWIGFSAIHFEEAPEPSTGALLGLGLLWLGARRRAAPSSASAPSTATGRKSRSSTSR